MCITGSTSGQKQPNKYSYHTKRAAKPVKDRYSDYVSCWRLKVAGRGSQNGWQNNSKRIVSQNNSRQIPNKRMAKRIRVYIKYCVFSKNSRKFATFSLPALGVTVHSHCVESFGGLLQRCMRGSGCSELWKNTIFPEHPVYSHIFMEKSWECA